MKQESVKLFLRQRAWLLLLVCFLLRLGTACLQPNREADWQAEVSRGAYLHHMAVLEGRLTDEKRAYIEAENTQIREALSADPIAAHRAYADGEIDEQEFDRTVLLHRSGSEREQEFAAINDCFLRVSENPDRVYFVYPNGWIWLMGNDSTDFVLIMLIMLLTVPMICNEFSTGMYPILRTTANGGARLYAAKAGVCILAAVLAAVLMFAAQVICCAAVLGLPHGEYPLQSLRPFAQSPYAVSICGGALLTLLNRCIGAVYLALLMLCLSAVFRRALSAVFLGTASLLLPLMLFSQSDAKYRLPAPLGFLHAAGYLRGTFPASPGSQETVTVTVPQYCGVLAASAGIMVLLFCIGMIAYTGIPLRIRRRRIPPCMLCVCALLLTGCADSPPQNPDWTGFVFDQTKCVRTDRFTLQSDGQELWLEFPDSGGRARVCRDCFPDTDIQHGFPYFANGKTVWYVRRYSNYHLAVIALDTDDFSEKAVYELESSDNLGHRDLLFGLGAYLPTARPELVDIQCFFVHGGQLIMQQNRGIFCYDLDTGTEACLFDGYSRGLAYTDGALYFIDAFSDLYRYDLTDSVCEKLPVGKLDGLYAAENGLYCIAVRGGVYFVSTDGSTVTPLPDADPSDLEGTTDERSMMQ